MLRGTMHPGTPVSLHPGLVTVRFSETCEFYAEHFGFAVVEITAEFALLGRPDGARLALLQAHGDGQLAALRSPTRGSGVWLALTCDDVDAMHERLCRAGVEIVADPEFTLDGGRRCVVRDPNGVLIYLQNPRTSVHDAEAFSSATRKPVHHHEDQRHRVRWLPCH